MRDRLSQFPAAAQTTGLALNSRQSRQLSENMLQSELFVVVVVVVDSHIQRFVLVTEETTVTQQVRHRPIKCQSRSWSQRGTKANGSYHGDSPLLKPTGIQIATKPLPGPTNREHRKRIGVETMSLGTIYSFYCLECCLLALSARNGFGPKTGNIK